MNFRVLQGNRELQQDRYRRCRRFRIERQTLQAKLAHMICCVQGREAVYPATISAI